MSLKDIDAVRGNYEKYLSKKGKTLLERPFIDRCLKEVFNSRLLIISAPTGYGKTLVSLMEAYLTLENRDGWEKLIVAFPTRALINQQEERFRGTFETKESLVGTRYMGKAGSRYLSKPVTVTTYDTLSMTSFGLSPDDRISAGSEDYHLPHYVFSRFSAFISNIVFDEAHLLYDSQKSLDYLFFLVHLYSGVLNRRLVLLSATLPDSFTEPLVSRYGFRLLELGENDDANFWESRLAKRYKIDIKEVNERKEALSLMVQKVKEGNFKKALIVMNTVEDAQRVYLSLKGLKSNVLLIHSRYTDEDKERRAEEINKMNEGILVGTQSVEVGLDNSFDLIITDSAPLNSLVQRFGRFLRDEKDREGDAYIIFDKQEAQGKYRGVYDMDLVKRSLSAILKMQERGERVNLHVGYKPLLNEVYPDRVALNYDEVSEMNRVFGDFVFDSLSKFFRKNGGSFVRDEVLVEGRISGIAVPVELSFAERHLGKVVCGSGEVITPRSKGLIDYAIDGCAFELEGVEYDGELGLVSRSA